MRVYLCSVAALGTEELQGFVEVIAVAVHRNHGAKVLLF